MLFCFVATQICPEKMKAGNVVAEASKFIIGLILSDLENMKSRPLDRLRNLSFPLMVLRNLVLAYIFVLYGGLIWTSEK